MWYIPKIDEYLKILADKEVKDFVAINFSDFIKEEQNLREAPRSLYFGPTALDEVQSTFSDSYIRHYNV